MPMRNYTTKIDPEKTIDEIRAILVKKAGALNFQVVYSAKGEPKSIAFTREAPWGVAEYRLPAVDPILVQDRLYEQDGISVSEAQASRIAWRNLKDYLDSQIAVTGLGTVNLDQVLTPHLIVDDAGTTLYGALTVHGARALPSPL